MNKGKSKGEHPPKRTIAVGSQAKLKFEPFRFEKRTDADLLPPLVTIESKIAEFVETARRETEWSAEDKRKGKNKQARNLAAMAKASRAKAAKWRKLSSLSKAEDERLDWQCYQGLADGVDLLAARGLASNEAKFWLSSIIEQAAQGLLALAAHGDGVAATMLIDSLLLAVRRFECLAMHRPKVFTHYTSKLSLIPATISRRSENKKECEKLLEELQVGTCSIYPTTRKGKGRDWSESTPANALALRLIRYIDNRRRDRRIYSAHLEIFDTCPPWFQSLDTLADFSPDSCEEWANVAWQILDNGKHPALYEKATRVCNVRESRTEDNFSKSANSAPRKIRKCPSIAVEDIREAIFGAFRIIATGVSERTMRRKKTSPDK